MLLVPVIFINLSCSQSNHNYGYGHLKLHAITRVSSLAIVISRAEKKWEEGGGGGPYSRGAFTLREARI